MAIVRWNDPFAGLTSMHSQLDDLFSTFFGSGVQGAAGRLPAMDVYTEDDKALVAEVSAPGFSKDDIEVNVHEGILEIKGEKHATEEDKATKKRNYMMRESHESFYRRLALPKQANEGEVQAEFTDGLLKVTVPFKALPAPKRVAIGNGGNKPAKK